MKNLMYFAYALLLWGASRKVNQPGKVVPEKQMSASIQKWAPVFSGTNTTWKLNQFISVNTPSFTDLPNHSNSYYPLTANQTLVPVITRVDVFRLFHKHTGSRYFETVT